MKVRSLQYKVLFFVLLVFWVLAKTSYAYTPKIINQISQKYALLLIYDAEPNTPLDVAYINALANNVFETLHVIQLDIAIYNSGKKYGDGVRALAVKFANQSGKELNIYEANEEEEKLLESGLGLYCTP